jgi:hypothetical protein
LALPGTLALFQLPSQIRDFALQRFNRFLQLPDYFPRCLQIFDPVCVYH